MATHLRIEGLVQGVGYRAAFEAQARALQLSGWVRNRRDGSVEAMVSGEAAAIEKIVAWSRRGPSSARVTRVAVQESAEPAGSGFEVRATA
ncbi:MAG TPA: acylphosphatase [Noviherbaspirillum sp.]|uniref:acylphosphatase n=1 Tax=Noviherbaspirillum sp. TaxID=1926288 RepID=UPI002D5C0EF4|nr:acylphosphatase [Noviherbaspirillum sp.]HYD94263.1 acylphosphatase [Noviherbaspirillum sp.]